MLLPFPVTPGPFFAFAYERSLSQGNTDCRMEFWEGIGRKPQTVQRRNRVCGRLPSSVQGRQEWFSLSHCGTQGTTSRSQEPVGLLELRGKIRRVGDAWGGPVELKTVDFDREGRERRGESDERLICFFLRRSGGL